MIISEEYFVFTEKDSQNVFSLCTMSGQKNFIQSLLAIIIKRQLLQVKNCFRLLKPYFFYSHCRWRSKLKYILLCNEDIIKMWSHKRENYYNHCNRCPVYSEIALHHVKPSYDTCHCYLQQIIVLTSLGKWHLQEHYIYKQYAAKIGCCPEKVS